VTWAGSLLVRHGDAVVSDAWISSRVAGDHGGLYGTLDPGLALSDVARRAVPLI
jgi:putative acyl-CoA dehydrogenase